MRAERGRTSRETVLPKSWAQIDAAVRVCSHSTSALQRMQPKLPGWDCHNLRYLNPNLAPMCSSLGTPLPPPSCPDAGRRCILKQDDGCPVPNKPDVCCFADKHTALMADTYQNNHFFTEHWWKVSLGENLAASLPHWPSHFIYSP